MMKRYNSLLWQKGVISLDEFINKARLSLAHADHLGAISALAACTGIFVGLIVSLFRLSIETIQIMFLAAGDPENYEALISITRLILPIIGATVLIVIAKLFRTQMRVGVMHVMERMAYHEGHLPFKPMLFQFISGAVAIISGFSVGREGPSIHLGAATSSLLGQRLRLPNNAIRSLVACGVAAAIAASFNTPLAGVIFAMEVILMEYTIIGFTPIIIASVSATVIHYLIFGDDTVFSVPAFALQNIWELGLIIFLGFLIGLQSTCFIVLTRRITAFASKYSLTIRYLSAGILVGLIGSFVPEVMSLGYDTVNLSIAGKIGLFTLLLIIVFKLIATSISIGLGIPAGLIGPSLFMGAITGSSFGLIVAQFVGDTSAYGFYAILGMGAMMGATLQAPLAALLAVLELTGNLNSILPGMLAIISAHLFCRSLFKQESIFISQSRQLGLDYRHDPLSQSLRRVAVMSVVNTSCALVQESLPRKACETIAESNPEWLIIRRDNGNLLMPTLDLARYLVENEDDEIVFTEIPSKRLELLPVSEESTLEHAKHLLDDSEADALYVIRRLSASADKIFGVITSADIEKSYRIKSN